MKKEKENLAIVKEKLINQDYRNRVATAKAQGAVNLAGSLRYTTDLPSDGKLRTGIVTKLFDFVAKAIVTKDNGIFTPLRESLEIQDNEQKISVRVSFDSDKFDGNLNDEVTYRIKTVDGKNGKINVAEFVSAN